MLLEQLLPMPLLLPQAPTLLVSLRQLQPQMLPPRLLPMLLLMVLLPRLPAVVMQQSPLVLPQPRPPHHVADVADTKANRIQS